VIVEAASCGIPCVGSTCGEIPYLVRELGGWTFPEGDVDALVVTLREAIKSVRERPVPWPELQCAAEAKYSKVVQARRLLALFQKAQGE
jgi:glycosyltransferase involved in cell wall biosynthesis